MQLRKLGRSGLEVAPLMLGGNVFGWTADQQASFRILDAFVDAGFNAIDTADVYSRWVPGHQGGESETVIGEWLKQGGRRGRVVLATKLGMPMPGGADGDAKGLSRANVVQAVDASLRRLQTDHIDLYQAHADDADAPLEETLSAFAELIKAGKVRAIGASNYTGARLKAALEASARLGLPRYETLQPHYNLYERAGYEADLAPVVREAGLGVIPYYGLASGFLTGKYRSEADLDKSPRGRGAKRYLNDRGHRILAALDAVAETHRATPAQVALAWLMSRPAVVPIASATSVDQLRDIARSADLGLSSDDLDRLDRASAAEPVSA